MKNNFRFSAFFLLIPLIFHSCNSADKSKDKSGDKSREFPTGMLFEKQDKLSGIPLASTPFGGDELPASVDLSDKMPPVGNQGIQQSCVAWAIAYGLKSYQEKLELGQQFTFSPSYIYNQINNGLNAPTYVTDALNLLSDQGVCVMDEMPYSENDWTTKPSTLAKTDAKKFRIDFWRQVNVSDIKEVKAQLAAGYPVIIGAEVSKEFGTDGFDQKAAYVWKEAGTSGGGHCMLLTGYNDQKGAFKVMNSWGKEWGDNGFGWIDYKLFPQVIKYGFVAKDAITTNAPKNPDIVDNNPVNNQKQPEIQPYNDPTAFEKIDFSSTNVQHNVPNPNDPRVGNNMKIEGRVDIPATYGRKFQIVVHIYNSSTRQQVKSLIYPTYADINGYAAGYTPVYDVTAEGFRNGTWWIDIPYSALSMPSGRNYFYAVPTLFVDSYGIAIGDKIEFYVDQP